jgi:hypothetical protein
MLVIPIGCMHKPISDDNLAKSFMANKSLFNNLETSYLEGRLSCSDKSDRDICVLPDSSPIVIHLRESAQVESVYVKRNPAGDSGIWIPVQTYGAMSTASSTRGYVYLNHSPAATVSDTLSTDQKGSHYKPLADRWYLFTVN